MFVDSLAFLANDLQDRPCENELLLDRDAICQIRAALPKIDSGGNAIRKKFDSGHLFIRRSA